MTRQFALRAVAALIVLSGCGGDTGDTTGNTDAKPLTAATLGEQTVLRTAEYLAGSPFAEANKENGERQAQICRACHSLEKGGANMIGPNLFGFFGKPVGTVAGYDYSKAIQEAVFDWTPRALDAWLSQPGRFLPGNRMTFAGVGAAGDRVDLIAYLLHVTNKDQVMDE